MMKVSVQVLWLLVGVISLAACDSGQTKEKQTEGVRSERAGNPIIQEVFTADPAPFVANDTFYIYTGHDQQSEGGEGFLMNDWLLFSSTDMVNWERHGAKLRTTDFAWANGQAWAAHTEQKNGKYYWYVTVEHATIPGKAIGVAVADHPTGPWEDAIGEALITNDMTTQTDIFWDDIDPAVFVDESGSAYIYWGNTVLKWAKLKDNMIELDGPVHTISVPEFTEAPWVFKREELYYLIYSAHFPEEIDYAMSDSPEGPWEYKGNLNGALPNSPTHHVGVEEYKGNWYFVYHTGQLPTGGEFRRSVCIDRLYFNEDGTIKPVIKTDSGVGIIE
ncbi:glycoside hydrolase family 43 protein [Reichenbachiella sp. MSK19-1]|uniref:glycoside hydrolase family 43 protein n=1 Tax=Reichenbachiella sp. MSK19-1 TaxID=1897631 RepID=UPI000ED7DAE7|nr:glycoside hydrolase family 43 protein [Reichenbachiella sp. MSK19-1]RJE72736.1 glycoside hydrolase [Reichenbachiella sp. MSK19-1]